MYINEFSTYLSRIESTASRNEITQVLSELFTNLESGEMYAAVQISLGQLRPKYDRLEFNLAEKMVLRAISETYSVDPDAIKQSYQQVGDIGDLVAHLSEQRQSTEHLDITQVYSTLQEIALDAGSGSQDRKIVALCELLTQVDSLSAKYIVRMVVGKLRLGFSDMTILDALSWMERGDKSGRKQLENAYQLAPDIGEIARLTKLHTITQVEDNIEIKVGTPVIPALAQRLKTADEMIKKMGKVTVDPKYDGTRVQVHFKKEKSKGSKDTILVKSFTRNLDESSQMFPELHEFEQYIQAHEVILDCEAIGYDPQTKSLLPFQMTIQRKRKHDVSEMAAQIPLKFFVFDILYKDGKSLLKTPLHERIEILKETIIDSDVIEITEFIVTQNPDEIRSYHADLLAQGLEGAMVKKYSGIYNPGRKGWSWVKFKEAEGTAAKLSDTIDAVVMGLYAGKGKRAAFGVGAFLIGVRGEDDLFYTISKVGTGLSDDQWRELKERSKACEVQSQPKHYSVHKDLIPDVWLDPHIVVEVAADEITNSSNHSATVALRFPRLKNFRDDKDFSQITTRKELSEIDIA